MVSGIEIRAYRSGDEAALIQTWNEAMWADPIDSLTWRTRYLLDSNFDATHCLVASEGVDGDAIGFVLGMITPSSSDAWVVAFGVRESYRRRGIATALVTALLEKLKAAGKTRAVVGPYVPSYVTPGVDESAYPEAIAFLASIGASTSSRPLSMKASLTGYRPVPEVASKTSRLAVEGVVIRRCEASDILPLLQFLDDHFPHWRPDATSVLLELFGGDPGNVTMFLAEDRGAVIGYAQSRSERFGPFGVNEAYRGRGIGAVLLSNVLMAMRSRGFHSAWFLWTSDRAAKLYQEHGFEEVRRFALMSKELST